MKKYLNRDTGEEFTIEELEELYNQFKYEMNFETFEDFTNTLEEIED